MSDWYICDSPERRGPYSLNDLRTMLQDGDLPPEGRVALGRDGEPRVARDVPELAAAAAYAPRDNAPRRAGRGNLTGGDGDSNVIIWVIVLAVLAFLLVGGGLLTLVAVMFPAVNEVRTAARRSMSEQRLHNIVLAVINYEGVHSTFPPGGLILADGTEWHGWGTYLLPYLDQQPLYTAMDVDHRGWTDPAVQPLLTSTVEQYMNPMVADQRDSLGRGVNHYAANQYVFFENSAKKNTDIADGTSFTLGFGEIASDFPPWASVRNFRDPGNGLGSAGDQFSDPEWQGAQFGFLDGQVKFLDATLDPLLLLRLAQPDDGAVVTLP